jgi:plastocyanin
MGCALALQLAPLAADQSRTPPPKAPASRVVQITIDKVAFAEAPTGIKVGDTIEWVNHDIFDHTSTSRTGLWDVTVPAGKKMRVVMKKIGSLEYYCKLHPNMSGTLVVGR